MNRSQDRFVPPAHRHPRRRHPRRESGLLPLAFTLLVVLSVGANPIHAAPLEHSIEQTRRHGEDAVYVRDVAISLGLSDEHGVRVKHIEVRFSDEHRRFIAVTEALKRSVSGVLIPMADAEATEALDVELSFWKMHFDMNRHTRSSEQRNNPDTNRPQPTGRRLSLCLQAPPAHPSIIAPCAV